MSDKTDTLILQLAKELVGEDAADLLKYLLKKRTEITDEELAKELNVKPNGTLGCVTSKITPV